MAISDPKDDLRRYLQVARDVMVWKLDGLSEYDARRPLTPTGTNLLGLVKHLGWVEAGYLDFICPMDYTDSDLAFSNLVTCQMRLVDGRIPVYPGIGATASRTTLSADRVAGQVHIARRLGAAGFTVFNLSPSTATEILPGMALGPGPQPAVPPHRE